MSTKEIRDEIQRLLENVPYEVLINLLEYLKTTQDQASDKSELSINLRKIISEDKELLEKLAK